MADVTLAIAAVEDTPLDYPIPGAAELLIKMLSAAYNGSGAAGNFVPAVQVIIGGTIVAGTFPLGQTLAAGASADVSWFPDGAVTAQSSIATGAWHYATPVAPASPPAGGVASVGFQNGWANTALPDGSYSPLRWRLTQDGVTQIVGAIDGGALGTTVVTLPAGFVPDDDVVLPVGSTDGSTMLVVTISASTGNVVVEATSVPATSGISELTSVDGTVTITDPSGPTADLSAPGVRTLTSTGSTITVTNPTGPTANVDLPNSGAAAGTYGDATHTAQVTVNNKGVVTGAAQVPISGISGTGLVKLYDSGYLGASQASLDTGANAIPSGHFCLLVHAYVRSDHVAIDDTIQIRLNGDSGAHYDVQRFFTNQGTLTGSATLANSSLVAGGNFPAASEAANVFGYVEVTLPFYDNTASFKPANVIVVDPSETLGDIFYFTQASQWRSTAAVNQITFVSALGGNFVAGSRLVVYGLQ